MGLLLADIDIQHAGAGSHATEFDYDLLDPPPDDSQDWHKLYAEELDSSPGVAWDLAQENPVAAIAKRAGLTPAELDVFRDWAAGDSLSSISRATGKNKITVATLIDRALFRLRELDERSMQIADETKREAIVTALVEAGWDLPQDEVDAMHMASVGRLTPAQEEAFGLFAAGRSLSAIARSMGRQKRAVATLLDRAVDRLLAVAPGTARGPSASSTAEAQCRAPQETSSPPSSPSWLAMPAVS